MSLNQKIILLVLLVGAVAAIAVYETRSDTPKSTDTTATASAPDKQASSDDGLDLTRDEDASSTSTSTSTESENTIDAGQDTEDAEVEQKSSSGTSTSGSSSGSGSSTDSEVTFSGEFATTEHSTYEPETGSTDELTLTPGEQSSSAESSGDSGDTAEQASADQETVQNGNNIPTASAATSTSASSGSSDATPEVTTTTQQYRTYEVQSGDNLWKIAEKQYGSGSQWKRIKKANSDKIGDANDLKQGQTLRIPTESSSSGSSSTTAAASANDGTQNISVQRDTSGAENQTNGSTSAESATSTASDTGDETGSSSTYTVKEGDRLWGIVKEAYGSATYERVQKVADHNDINPRELRPGMEIDLPADLASSGSTGTSGSSAESASSSGTAGTPPFEASSGRKWYRVKQGENLWKISEKELGSGEYFRRIWKLNKDRLEDYNSLSTGTWVLLPENP